MHDGIAQYRMCIAAKVYIVIRAPTASPLRIWVENYRFFAALRTSNILGLRPQLHRTLLT